MKKIVVIILILGLLSVAVYFGWQNREKYFFQGEENFEVSDDEVDVDAEKILEQEDELGIDDGENVSEEEDGDDEDEFVSDEDEYAAPVISGDDCNNECDDFSGDELDYCNEFCGFSEDDPNRESDNCEDLSKLKRDACFKQQAVDEKDASICKKISDGDLEENCENRVLEEILK